MRDQGELTAVVSRENRRIVYKAWVEGSLLVLQRVCSPILQEVRGRDAHCHHFSDLIISVLSRPSCWLMATNLPLKYKEEEMG